jgi:hypothetical protein
LRTTRFHIPLTQLTNFASIFSPIFEREKTEGGLSELREARSMQKAHRKHVFDEVEVASIAFRAMLHEGRVLLHVEDASGRESEVPLMGLGMPSPFYGEAWTVRGRKGNRGASSPFFERLGRRYDIEFAGRLTVGRSRGSPSSDVSGRGHFRCLAPEGPDLIPPAPRS